MKENKYTSNHAFEQGEKTRAMILDFIKEFIAEHGYSPLMVEISKDIGKSIAVISKHIQKLIADGYLDMDYETKSRRNLYIPTEVKNV